MDTRRGVRRKAAVISPLLSNIYLNPLDHLMAQRGFEMVRYADDFVIMCRSPEDAAGALALVQEWTAAAGLTLHPTKTKIIDAKTGAFDFLGYRFLRGTRFPRPKSMQKIKDTIRAKTKRTSGESLTKIINDLRPTLRGWFEYFKHSQRSKRSLAWTGGFGCGCEACYENARARAGVVEAEIISDGQTPSLPREDCIA